MFRPAFIALLLSACVKISPFVCTTDPDCAPGGFCEATTHYCSFADPMCDPTGRRYGQYAGDVSNQCTDPGSGGPDAGPDAGPAAPCGKTDAISDDFEAASIAGAWNGSFQHNGATVTQTGGHLVFAIPTTAGGFAGYISRVTYDLTESQIFVEAPVVPNASANSEMYLELYKDGSNGIKFVLRGGRLHFQTEIAGVTSDVSSAPYVASAHRFWQLRESNHVVYWDVSPTGAPGTFTPLENTPDPFDLTQLFVELSAGDSSADASPGAPEFDNLNVYAGARTGGLFCASASIHDTFDAPAPDPLWNAGYMIDSCTSTQNTGEFVVTPAAVANSYCSYVSGTAYQLAGSSIEIKVTGMVDTSTVAEAYLEVNDPTSTDMMAIDQQEGSLTFRKRINNTYTNIYSVTYSPTAHLYWRIRESDGMVTAETSDGNTWTALGPPVADPIETTWIQLEIGAGTYSGATGGSAHFDDLNGK
jgi:hypothetical protein